METRVSLRYFVSSCGLKSSKLITFAGVAHNILSIFNSHTILYISSLDRTNIHLNKFLDNIYHFS